MVFAIFPLNFKILCPGVPYGYNVRATYHAVARTTVPSVFKRKSESFWQTTEQLNTRTPAKPTYFAKTTAVFARV